VCIYAYIYKRSFTATMSGCLAPFFLACGKVLRRCTCKTRQIILSLSLSIYICILLGAVLLCLWETCEDAPEKQGAGHLIYMFTSISLLSLSLSIYIYIYIYIHVYAPRGRLRTPRWLYVQGGGWGG